MMESNVEEPLDQEMLARFVGLSRRQLERLFRKHLGRTPAQYYLELRLERARHLLYQTTMPIMNVAFACGFVSASHFSTCYRQMYGKTPRASAPARCIGREATRGAGGGRIQRRRSRVAQPSPGATGDRPWSARSPPSCTSPI